MTVSDKSFDQLPVSARQEQLVGLFDTLHETVRRYERQIPGGIFSLDEEAQQKFIDKINPYIKFEFANQPELHGLPISATGVGMLFVSDLEGNIMGAETIREDDVITGSISEIWAFPVPTVDCILENNDAGIPLHDQIVSPVLVLKDGLFKSTMSEDSVHETEHDLSNFQVCLPLAHYLKFTA